MSFVNLDDLAGGDDSPHPRYLVGDYFPVGGLTVVHARPGVGKSTFLAGLAGTLEHNIMEPDERTWGEMPFTVRPFAIAMIDYENGRSVNERIRAVYDGDERSLYVHDDPRPATDPDEWLADLRQTFAIDSGHLRPPPGFIGRGEFIWPDGRNVSMESWNEARMYMEDAIRHQSGWSIEPHYPLLTIDPLRAVVDGREAETPVVTMILERLRRLAAADPPMVVIVAAHTLGGTDRPFGGDPIRSIPDQILYLPGETGPPKVLRMQKNRHGPLAPDLPLTFTQVDGVPVLLPGDSGVVVLDNGVAVSEHASEAYASLAVAGDWLSTNEWAEAAGVIRNHMPGIYRELIDAEMVERRRRRGQGGGYEWLAKLHKTNDRSPTKVHEAAPKLHIEQPHGE